MMLGHTSHDYGMKTPVNLNYLQVVVPIASYLLISRIMLHIKILPVVSRIRNYICIYVVIC